MADIICQVLESSHKDQAIACLSETFLINEPMTRVVGLTREEFGFFIEIVVDKAIEDGLSVVAVDQASGKLAGCFISEDFLADPPRGMEKVSPKMRPILDLLEALDDEYKAHHPVRPGELVRMFMAGVYKEYAGAGIAAAATRVMEDIARSKKYLGSVAEATGPVSQRVLQKLGYEERGSQSYKDYVFKGERVFKDIQQAETCKLFYKTL